MVASRVVDVVVDAHDKGLVHLLAGSGDHHLLGAGGEVGARLFAAAEQPGRLEDIVDAEFLPRQLGGVALGEDLHAVAVDDEVRPVDLDRALVAAVHRVVTEQVTQHVRRGEIVDGHQVKAVAGLEMAGNEPADASETVDRDLGRHVLLQVIGMARKYNR